MVCRPRRVMRVADSSGCFGVCMGRQTVPQTREKRSSGDASSASAELRYKPLRYRLPDFVGAIPAMTCPKNSTRWLHRQLLQPQEGVNSSEWRTLTWQALRDSMYRFPGEATLIYLRIPSLPMTSR